MGFADNSAEEANFTGARSVVTAAAAVHVVYLQCAGIIEPADFAPTTEEHQGDGPFAVISYQRCYPLPCENPFMGLG